MVGSSDEQPRNVSARSMSKVYFTTRVFFKRYKYKAFIFTCDPIEASLAQKLTPKFYLLNSKLLPLTC